MSIYDEKKAAQPPVQREAMTDGPANAGKNDLRGTTFAEGEAKRAPAKDDPAATIVAAVKGDLHYRDRTPVKVGDDIKIKGLYTTDDPATLTLKDGSSINLGANSLFVHYGDRSKTAKSDQREKTQVLSKPGSFPGGLAALDDKKE